MDRRKVRFIPGPARSGGRRQARKSDVPELEALRCCETTHLGDAMFFMSRHGNKPDPGPI